MSPCERADVANNRGWAALVLAANTGSDAAPSLGPLHDAERGYVECTNPRRLANARVNLARAHLLAGDVERAKESLRGAREAQPRLDALVALFADDVDARIALAERKASSAEARFREVAERARARIALGEGRGTFRATRDAAARLRMEIALAEKDHRRALAVARATRARAGADLTRLTSHASERPSAREARASAVSELTKAREALLTEAEHDWELPADAAARAREARAEKALRTTALYEEHLRSLDVAATRLVDVPALAPGEVDLVIHPTLDGWVALAVTAQAVRISRLDRLRAEASGAELARSLVEPFDAELSTAKRVRVLASGAMRAVDVHALPWRGRPLGAALTVVYAADVPRGGPIDRDRGALVVVDPRVDLRAAKHEGDLARAALARSGREVHLLAGPDATRAELLARLGRASFFHYAGHATHAGPDGWESALLLSRGTVLGVADLVTLERAPAVVVLSACDAAREVGAAGEEQVGIAQALLAAHAAVIVAATRPVDDATTAALMNASYTELASGQSPEDALARAQAALREASPAADWAAFRALVHGMG